MTRILSKLAFASVAAALIAASASHAIDYKWNVLGGGSQTWGTAANWLPNTNFPNDISALADLSVPLTGDLNVSIGSSNITLGGLNIGGSGAAVSTTISGTGKLIFSNNDDPDFDDNNQINGDDLMIWQRNLGSGTTNATGDANGDGRVDAADLRAWKQSAISAFTPAGTPLVYPGRPVITSNGAAGTVNTISVPVVSGVRVDEVPTYRDETVEVRGTRSLNLAGGYRLAGPGNTLNSFLPDGATLTINNIVLEEDTETTEPITNRSLSINTSAAALGRVEIPGVISGGGSITLGHTGQNSPIATFVLSGNNTFLGRTTLNRGTLVLDSDTALGNHDGPNDDAADLKEGNPSNHAGFNLVSTSDTRKISVEHQLAQFSTIAGEHSLEWAGVTAQTNSRGFINLLPAGKVFTHSGNIYGVTGTDTTRTITFDGSGKTVVTGLLSHKRYNINNTILGVVPPNSEDPDTTGVVTSLVKDGTGALELNGGATYNGSTTVNGGNLHYSVFNDDIAASAININFGAVGASAFVSTGVPDTLQTNQFFLAKISTTSTGGIEIPASESGVTYDFTAGLLQIISDSGAKLSLAAPDAGLTFTGSIVPQSATYRLGGGSGTLTLPNAQLTGANSLEVTNGGVVQLNGANTYSGTTSVLAKYTSSRTAAALLNVGSATGGASSITNAATNRVYGGTVLAVGNLQNGGVPSSLGSSSNVASNLIIQGSTLRYTGTGASSDRLFTVGTGGATIEASGTGAVNFTNTGALAMDEAEARDGTTATTANVTDVASTADLIVGMPVSGTNVPANATVASVTGPTSFTLSANGTAAGTSSLTFGSVARTLTLSGTNAGNNTLRPNIVNGGAATNVAKTGSGTWILTGTNNTYTGTTTVSAGTLLVNGTNSGGGAVTVASGATLGGSGSITGAINVSGTLAAGASAGTLTVTGGVTFNAGSTALVEIGGTGATQFDQLNMTGALVAGGTFDVDLIGGFTPSIGNSFDVFDFGSASGAFAFSLPALGPGMAWNTSALLTTGTISVVAGIGIVPEPSAMALIVAGLLAVRPIRRRCR